MKQVLVFLELFRVKIVVSLTTGEAMIFDRAWLTKAVKSTYTYHPRISIESSLDLFFVSLRSKASIASHLAAKVIQSIGLLTHSRVG